MVIRIGSIHDNALHDLTLIIMIVARFVGTGSFLIGYSNSCHQLKTFCDYFNKTLFLI